MSEKIKVSVGRLSGDEHGFYASTVEKHRSVDDHKEVYQEETGYKKEEALETLAETLGVEVSEFDIVSQPIPSVRETYNEFSDNEEITITEDEKIDILLEYIQQLANDDVEIPTDFNEFMKEKLGLYV